MLNVIKEAHKTAEVAKAKLLEAEAFAKESVRVVEALATALTEAETKSFADWKTANEAAAKKP